MVLVIKMTRNKAKLLRRQTALTIIAVFLIILIFLIFLDSRARPIIKTVAASRAKNIATQIISDSVGEAVGSKNINYDDLTQFLYDEKGNIKAVNINLKTANIIEQQVSDLIAEKLKNTERTLLEIPVGTIIGGDFLSGRGPKLKIYISLSGHSYTNIDNQFEAAGINQTRHQINIFIKTDIYIIMYGNNTSTSVENNIAIAETIIIGNVPYAYSEGEKQS